MSRALPLEEIPVFDQQHRLPEELTPQEPAVILFDKPAGWSSFKAVKAIRKRLNIKKVGHAGTLDPLATGLLVICVNKATKSISQVQELHKTYRALIRFGASTSSYDAATEIDMEAPFNHIDRNLIEAELAQSFNEEFEQIPPMFSAIKKNGQRLYKLARKGETVERKARKVTIFKTVIHSYDPPDLDLDIECSKGTYIRSIAHDLGINLGSRAYLAGLHRTKIGTFDVRNALQADDLQVAKSS
ncbi:MAG TPA: tRNA pseudouridine(55) synthase TruB [Balneolales bacterium]|nr:tRNA pseudouridine(55) synthase TruB [Balneolales bacterium]